MHSCLHELKTNTNENKIIEIFKSYITNSPHMTDFFEIMAFEKAEGIIELNGHELEVTNNSLFLIYPFQKKTSCDIFLTRIKGFHLVFQNDFFDDKLFAY